MTNGNLSVNGRKARDCRAVTAQSLEFFFRTWTETKWHLGQNAGLKAMGRSIKFSVWFAEVTLMTSNPLLNTFINFHSACLTKKGLMNFLSMVSFFLSLLEGCFDLRQRMRWGSFDVIVLPELPQHQSCKSMAWQTVTGPLQT